MKKILSLLLIVISINAKSQQIIDKEWSPPADTPTLKFDIPLLIIDSMPVTKAILFLTRCDDCSMISRTGYVSGYLWNLHYYDIKKRNLFTRRFYRNAFVVGWVNTKQFKKHVML